MLGYVLDVTRVNALSVYCLNTGKDPRTGTDSFRFGWDLAMSLVKPNMVARLPTMKNRAIRTKIDMFIKPEDKEAEEEEELELVNNQGDNQEDPGEQEEPPCQEDQHEEELFPHKSYSDERQRCQTCVRSLPVQGYRALHQKLTRSKTRCGRWVVVLICLAKYP